jgi:hypothetical protein
MRMAPRQQHCVRQLKYRRLLIAIERWSVAEKVAEPERA